MIYLVLGLGWVRCSSLSWVGKNSITVRKVQYSPKDMNGNKKISLSSRDPIRIGNIGFYFLRSTFEKPKEAYAELARKVRNLFMC